MEPRPRVQGGSQQAKLYGWRGERAVVIAEKRGVRREGWGAEKEEEIERKKVEVRDKVFSMLGRVEQESKRLAFIRQELEVMADPTRREVESIRKRVDKLNRQLKPLGKSCLKKEKEYKMCLEAYDEKSNEKATLVNRLVELVGESERLRMKKLEELSKTIETLY